jgi:alkylation response protein AidB-like acyl-CoA dehydrogenase
MNAINTDTLATERQAFADLAKDFSAKKLAEHREEHDRYPFGGLFSEAINDAGVIGFYGINLPVDYGGVGMNAVMVAAILEKLSEVDASLAGVVLTNAAALEIIQTASESTGSQNIYQNAGRFGAIPLAFQTYAGPKESEMPLTDDSGTSLTGRVPYLVLGGIADFAVIPARNKGPEGFSYYLVDLGSDRVHKSKPVVSLGLHACPAVDIILDGAPAVLIGTRGSGTEYFETMRDRLSVCTAAMFLGIMRGSLQDALVYTADRYQGGRQIIDWPQVRMMLANMAIEVKIAESCLATACREFDGDEPGWEMTARAAAIHLGELANRVATDGVQLFGGNGYTRDYPQEKRMRDAKQAQCLLGMALLRKMDYIARLIEEKQ